jgi:hypothetical protein
MGRPLPPDSKGQGRFRADLNISKYVEAVGGLDFVLGVGSRKLSAVERETRRQEKAAYEERLANTPQKMSTAPAVASSCRMLMSIRDSRVIWDVAGYYRALGFRWPFRDITKKMLREAYVAVGGPDDARLTTIFKMLLDPVERAKYDAASPIEIYLDKIRDYEIQQRAAYEASKRSATGVHTSKEDVLNEWGLRTLDEDQNSPSPEVDSVAPVGHSADDQEPEPGSWTWWPWGYYVWGSRSTEFAKLAEWQALLVRYFDDLGVRRRFAVGFHDTKRAPSSWVTAVSGSDLVVFLREDADPTDGNAAQAAAYVLAEHADETERRGHS